MIENMSFRKRNTFFILSAPVVLSVIIFPFNFSAAQMTAAESASAVATCIDASSIDPNNKVALQIALDACNKQIDAQNELLKSQQRKSVTLENTIQVLGTKINKAQLTIKAHDITISNLKSDIIQKAATINELEEKIQSEKDSIAQLLRKTNEIDQSSIVEVILSQKNLSDFFIDIDSFESIKLALRDSLDAIRAAKGMTEEEKVALEDKKAKEADARAAADAEKRNVQKNQQTEKQFLSISKNKEAAFQKILAEQKKKAAAISAALFELRDSGAIQFGDALRYAQVASGKTGVRPAFLLAIFSQESSMGVNQGSCLLRDKSTGSGVGVNTGRIFSNVMKPTRDVEPFFTITAELGKDPMNTRVSCPQGGIGWGGAMGPGQFIPSTWMELRHTVASMLGKTTTNPWNAQDALMATAIFLRDRGAAKGGYTAERTAACRYFGGTCSSSSLTASYGDQVMAKAADIQENKIDVMEGN